MAALGAARRLDELGAAGTVDVTVISAKPFHDIRVRNYEADLSACRIPLSDLLDPVGVGHTAAEVTAIDTAARTVTVSGDGAGGTQRYDRPAHLSPVEPRPRRAAGRRRADATGTTRSRTVTVRVFREVSPQSSPIDAADS